MLSPYRVLDLSGNRGVFCSYMLAELGADVICVEPPGGSSVRHRGPFFNSTHDIEGSLNWWAYGRNKRSIVLDVEAIGDRDALLKLINSADVLIETKKPGEMEGLGLDYEALSIGNPLLVYVSITPFGQTGPKASWEGTDITVLAAGGALLLSGDADRAPLRTSVPQAYAHAGAEGAAATLIALRERESSGRGQHIDISAQQAVTILTQGDILAAALDNRSVRRASGGFHAGRMLLRLAYPALDGHVSIALLFGPAFGLPTGRLMNLVWEDGCCDAELRDKDWLHMLNLLVSGKESFETYEEIKACVANWTATKTKSQLLSIAMEKKLLLAPALTTRDLVGSEQLAQRKFFQPLIIPAKKFKQDLPAAIRTQQLGPFARFGGSFSSPLRPAPKLGEHGEELLAELRVPSVRIRADATAPGSAPESAFDKKARLRLPLAGVKILDFMWAIAGPMATRMLADYGAEVIRVETSTHLDSLRGAPPFIGRRPGAENSALFHSCNAGKRMISLNLSNPGSREVVLDLVRWADVVGESFSAGVMDKFGLGYDALREVNPSIIMLSTCLMGQTGPLANFAGYGNLSSAMAGFQELTGWADRDAAGPFGPYTDFVAPKFNAVAILSALDHRRRTGEGQFIDLSQAESSMHLLAPVILDTLLNDKVATRRGNWDERYAPHGCYPVFGEDCWISIAVDSGEDWKALCFLLGRADLATDLRFSQRQDRVKNAAALDEILTGLLKHRDGKELESQLQSAGVAGHLLLDSKAAMEDPQLQSRGHFVSLSGKGQDSIVEATRSRLSRTPAQVRYGVPTLGRDNQEVLKNVLGYDNVKICELVSTGVLE